MSFLAVLYHYPFVDCSSILFNLLLSIHPSHHSSYTNYMFAVIVLLCTILVNMAPNAHISIDNSFDIDVGYSPIREDHDLLDTEYVFIDDCNELSDIDLNVLHLNIRGLISKQERLSRLITKLGGRNKVSVVSLNETWLRTDSEKLVNVPGFNYVGKVRQGRQGGGVGILVSEELRFRTLETLLPSTPTIESCCVEIKLAQSSIVVTSLYRPPNQCVRDSNNDMMKILDILSKNKHHQIICMDHNMDLLKCSKYKSTQEFIENLASNNFLVTITKPTRITHDSATLIDNIFLENRLSTTFKSSLLLDDISDHLPCLLRLEGLKPDKQDKQWVLKRKIMPKAIEHMKSRLSNENWLKLENLNCEDSFNTFHDTLLQALDKHCPEKLVPKKTKKSAQPWVTKGLQKCLSKQ